VESVRAKLERIEALVEAEAEAEAARTETD
jgi:hypothetical protein